MNKIEVNIMNPVAIKESEKMMAFTARLTQRGHAIKTMGDLMALYEKDYSYDLLKGLTKLPHPTIQKFGTINVAVVGASRRFLAQITRHQNEVKFMSASLQYSDYSDSADFCVPYEAFQTDVKKTYIRDQKNAMKNYKEAAEVMGHDAAGYLMPQGLRNILIISATPYQWKHMIGQRSCKRNTTEMRFVMLKIWNELYKIAPELFAMTTTGPFCQRGKCLEGKMCCGEPIPKTMEPLDMLHRDFPLIQERYEQMNLYDIYDMDTTIIKHKAGEEE